jgi:dGTPase
MNWDKLLSKTRLGRESSPSAKDVRSEYLRDWDRIVYSSAFRRLQDKTQVFPLAESDYVRTRLTHSLEVSSVGRSLGTLAGEIIAKRESVDSSILQDCGSIVATACLAHDIGNPPFGHSGEDAIRNWFKFAGRWCLDKIEPEHHEDFLNFEGNAQGFRVQTRLQNSTNQGGLQLTYAVLGAYTKYPRGSGSVGCNTELISEKKYGYFVGDADNFQKVANGISLIEKRPGVYARHPLAFLMEAADDICYRIVDLEDGHRVGRVSFQETEHLLWEIVADTIHASSEAVYRAIDDPKQKIEYLRAHAISCLIDAVVDVFGQRYDEIMKGTLEEDLVSLCTLNPQLEAIKKKSKAQVYSTPNVLHIEAAGFKVLGGLLELVVPTLLAGGITENMSEKKLWDIIPLQFRKGATPYERLLSATDFVSGMTDTYAVTTYKRLSGIELPTG